jgi:hypothetical protein
MRLSAYAVCTLCLCLLFTSCASSNTSIGNSSTSRPQGFFIGTWIGGGSDRDGCKSFDLSEDTQSSKSSFLCSGRGLGVWTVRGSWTTSDNILTFHATASGDRAVNGTVVMSYEEGKGLVVRSSDVEGIPTRAVYTK